MKSQNRLFLHEQEEKVSLRGRLRQTGSKMDNTNDVYKEKFTPRCQ